MRSTPSDTGRAQRINPFQAYVRSHALPEQGGVIALMSNRFQCGFVPLDQAALVEGWLFEGLANGGDESLEFGLVVADGLVSNFPVRSIT